MPVGGGRYEGMWGGRVWFVDYDHGTVGGYGDKPDAAQKNLQTVIDQSSEWDVIYIRPRAADTAGGDPQAILPASTANWDVPYTKEGLAIIGTCPGNSKASANATRLQGTATVVATPVVYAKAPYMTFENLTFRRGGSTSSGLRLGTGITPFALGSTVNNCVFWKIGSTATGGALYIDSWHNNILNSYFEECYLGIRLSGEFADPTGNVIRGCVFGQVASAISCNIYTSANALTTIIDQCIFATSQPTGGAEFGNKYINFTEASTGIISNCSFATATSTIATAVTNNGVLLVNCQYAPGTDLTT